jgi:hypothetical protein
VPESKITVAETSRDEQKLWLILFQIKAIRARLNSLAVQRGLFWTLALMIAAAAGIVGAAMDLGPLAFLAVAIVLAIIALAGSIAAVRSAWRMRTSPARAAAIADQRGDLKGRLATVQALAAAGRASLLWPYLIEDTYGARGLFEPARIEPRWFSRATWAMLAAIVLAALLIPSAVFERNHQAAIAQAGGMPGSGAVTADINNLEIRPADPALAPNAEIYADPATLDKLRQRLAEQQRRGGNGALSQLADKARSFADAIQGEITGRHPRDQPPVRMRLTDRDAKPGSVGDNDQSKPPPAQSNARGTGPSSDGNGDGSTSAQPHGPPPDSGMAAASPDTSDGMNSPGAQEGQPPPDSASAGDGGQGSAHGSGTDPSSLFGPPSSPPLGADSFKIAINADPSDEASAPGSPGYLPPRVKAPLNPVQYPDEPLARASVPSDDQMTIKRVFER